MAMFRKPWFWAVFTLVSAICTFWAARHFSEAFPIVTLNVTMDRQTALETADGLAGERGWGPEGASQAVQFSLDGEVQSFVELEAGGKPAYTEMLAGDLYSPYTWVVRRFAEGETNETIVRFRPDGSPYGFFEKMPEDEPGASLEPDAARLLAEEAVATGWDVNLGDYDLVEESHEVRPGGRTDHSLVYERPDQRIGEGRYRLRLTVAGDRFTGLTHFIKIPEAFSRRYAEMRSINDGIAGGAGFAVVIIYLAGGCVFGLFYLMRKRWVIWKPAVKWAVFIAGLQALTFLNQWPLLWMGYDTAISRTTFAFQQIAIAVGQMIAMGAVLALSFMAAESLGRRAFPQHIQLWRTWSGKVASTKSLLGQTIAGYLLIGIFFAYEVWLYFFASNTLGWWTPSSALTDPDVLANFFPWLTSIAISLQAGFWEECLFRAVPIAGAALLGRKFGKTWLWITAAMILQAVIFGGGHANYPAQPAYARLVELIIPALGFGGIYLLFGLVPAIVFHFAFDVVWFAMPLFAADTPGIWIDRGMVIVLTLVPLWVVLRARWKVGSFGEVPEEDFNRAWEAPPAPEVVEAEPVAAAAGLAPRMRTGLATVGVVGLVAWVLMAHFKTDAPVLGHTDREARSAAQSMLSESGVELEPEWRELSRVDAPLGLQDRFVWQEGGREAYEELLGQYLPIPRRIIRYARFEGDVAERAEEYRVYIRPDGTAQRLTHRLPEDTPGVELSEEEGRTIALNTVMDRYGLTADEIEEVSADSAQLPQRRDWTFVFKDPENYPMEEGEARIAVDISGDEVVSSGRFVHIPEEWERDYRSRRGITQVVQIASVVLLVLIYLAGGVAAVVRWSRHKFATATFAIFFGVLAAAGAIQLFNSFRTATAQFQTAQPFKLQAGILVIGGFIVLTAIAAVSALLIGLAHRMLPEQPRDGVGASVAAGFGLGALLAAVGAIGLRLAPSTMPSWPNMSSAGDLLPTIGAAIGPFSSWATGTALFLLAVAVLNASTAGWSRRQPMAIAFLILLGLIVTGSEGVESIPMWLVEGGLTGVVLLAVWVLVLRHHPALVPLVTATGATLGALREAIIGAYPGVLTGSVIGAAAIVAASLWWFKRLTADSLSTARTDTPAQPVGEAQEAEAVS
jgi:hypothetical protein